MYINLLHRHFDIYLHKGMALKKYISDRVGFFIISLLDYLENLTLRNLYLHKYKLPPMIIVLLLRLSL